MKWLSVWNENNAETVSLHKIKKDGVTAFNEPLRMDGWAMRSDFSDDINWRRGLFSCSQPLPPISPPLTGSPGVKRWTSSLRRSSSPLHSHHPLIPPFSSSSSPASHHRSLLSSHTHPLSRRRLIDEATFDNGIRNRGVCLVIRYYQSCLITAEEDLRQTDGFRGAADRAADNEARRRCALIYLAELIHPSQVLKFSELPQITRTSCCQGDSCASS